MFDHRERVPLPDSIWDDLRVASTATLSSELARRGLRQTLMRGVFPLRPGARLAGEAMTLRFVPAREDISGSGLVGNPEYPQRKAVESIAPGQVLVADGRGELGAGTFGSILGLRMARRGAAGIVTDGAVRDVAGLRALEMPVFAAAAHPAAHFALLLAADIDQPIGCGGVLVLPGDVIVGDDDGVVVLPRAVAAEVAREAREHEELEAFIERRIDAGASIVGVYPPNAETRAAYERSRTQH
jgi:regulator of RNase E activity RraA